MLLGEYILFVFVPWAFTDLPFTLVCLEVGLSFYLLQFCFDCFFTPANGESWQRKEWLAEELNRCVGGETEGQQRVNGLG